MASLVPANIYLQQSRKVHGGKISKILLVQHACKMHSGTLKERAKEGRLRKTMRKTKGTQRNTS